MVQTEFICLSISGLKYFSPHWTQTPAGPLLTTIKFQILSVRGVGAPRKMPPP
jgi:hypothetical protein